MNVCAFEILTTFNSRPHEEADGSYLTQPLTLRNLSTHGLTRRPTLIIRRKCNRQHLSTHGLTRRPTAIFHSFFVKNLIYYDILYITCFCFTLGIIEKPFFVNFDSLISVRTLDIFMFSPYSHYNINSSVTSKLGFAPICSTLFLYRSPRL